MTLTLATTESIRGVAGSASAITYTIFGDEVSAGPTNSFKVLAQGQLPAAAAALYTATGVQAIVKSMILVNTTGAMVPVTIYANGVAAGNSIGSFNIPANGEAMWAGDGWKMLDSNGGLVTTSSIGNNSITNAMLAQAAAFTFKGNNTGALANEADLTQAQATAMINAATTALKGLMSSVDKIKLNNVWVDMAAEYGFVGDDATLNDAAWTAFLASPAPTGATLFWPPGTYRSANEYNINQDKRWKVKGGGAWATIFKTTSATANVFNLSVPAWFTTFEDIGFATTATKTAGAAIAITAGNNIGIDIRRVAMTGIFIGIDAQGSQSANLSVWDAINYASPPVNGRCFRINGNTINVVIANSTSNGVPNAGAVAGSANIEINQSGAVQVYACDLIGAFNSCLINANQGGGTSIAACYFTNCFFDQSGGSTVKITGANTTNRVKFMQCGIAAGVVGGHAFEVAGTGAGAVGTATAMPAGISLVDCDIYYAPGGSTASGIHVNGCQDINVQNTRIAGFSGAGGVGAHVIPSAANQTRVRINGCRIGPNSNLTINNLVGVQCDVGASGLGALSITDNDIAGNGTAIVDNSTIAAGSSKFINNNLGAANGLSANLFAPAGVTLNVTEAIIAQIALPANAAKIGTTFKFTMSGIAVATATTQIKLHIGPLGTTADPAVMAAGASAAGLVGGLMVDGAVQISAVGATAGGSGAARVTTLTNTSAGIVTATGTFNSAVANFVTLGALCSAAGHTVRAATLEVLGPA